MTPPIRLHASAAWAVRLSVVAGLLVLLGSWEARPARGQDLPSREVLVFGVLATPDDQKVDPATGRGRSGTTGHFFQDHDIAQFTDLEAFCAAVRSNTTRIRTSPPKAGVERVWLHRGVGQGAMTPNAVPFCNKRSIKVVAGECPMMFLPNAGFVHRVHRFFRHGP